MKQLFCGGLDFTWLSIWHENTADLITQPNEDNDSLEKNLSIPQIIWCKNYKFLINFQNNKFKSFWDDALFEKKFKISREALFSKDFLNELY